MKAQDQEQDKIEQEILSKKGYEITKELCRTAFCRVYLANFNNQKVVIKSKKIEGKNLSKFLRNEKCFLSQKFENVVRYIDVFDENQYMFVIMEYCENSDLLKYIQKEDKGDKETQLEFIWRIIIFSVIGLDELHDLGIIHKDIRPENILLTSDNFPKIGSPDLSGKTDEGKGFIQFNGYTLLPESLGYICRELFYREKFSKKTDIWALGAVFYYLATGVPLFNTTDQSIISKGIYDEKPLENLDEDLKFIIKYMLQLNVDKRPFTDDIIENEIFQKYCKKYNYYDKLKNYFSQNEIQEYEIINISDFDYPSPLKENSETEKICIVTTADIHGHAFPMVQKNEKTGEEYEIGGLSYLSKFIEIFRNEWKDKVIYLDAGDTFSGGLESKLSDGEIMIDYYNYIKPDAITFGNHEFDNGWDFLSNYMNKINSPFLSANIYTKDKNEPYAKNTSLILNVGKIKLGIIAISTCDTPNTSSADFSNIIFKDCKEIIIQESTRLRPQVNAIILFAHIGLDCYNPPIKQNIYGIYDNKFETGSKEKGELKDLLDSLPENTIDIVIAGHLHQNYHYFYKDIPVVIPKENGTFINAVYLSFDKSGKLEKDKILIEGAIPITNKLYYDKKIKQTDRKLKLSHISFHGVKITKDEKLEKIFEKYKKKLEEYTETILTVDQLTYCYKENMETVFGDVSCDILIKETDSDFAIMSSGCFRTTWKTGKVSKGQVIEMFPFKNYIVSYVMTGKYIYKLLNDILNGRKYQVGGFSYVFKRELENEKETIKVINIIDEKDKKEIQEDKEYTIATYDFLIPKFGDDFVKVKKYYEPKELKTFKPFTETMIIGLKKVGNINYEEYRKKVPGRVNHI